MNYLAITKDDMLNGDGLRVVLWVSGCSVHCKNCQNAYGWDKNLGKPFTEKEEQGIFNELSRKHCSGITLSGGHPLEPYNIETLTDLCKKIKQKFPSKTIWIYTGWKWEDVKDLEIINYTDVLCDGEFIEELKDNLKHWVGSTNQRVIDVKESLKTGEVVLYD